MSTYQVEYSAGIWQVRTAAETLVPLLNGDKPVDAFVSGWRATGVYTGLAPILLLELVRDDGSEATWYLDEGMNRIGGDLEELSPEIRLGLARRVSEIVSNWDSLLVSPKPSWPSTMDGISTVNARTLAGLERLVRPAIAEDFTWHDISRADGNTLSIENPAAATIAVIEPLHVRSILTTDLQQAILVGLQTGRLAWHSPITGKSITDVHCIYVDHTVNLYRCVDSDHGLVFYVCCAGHEMQTVGVLFPTVRRAFYLTVMQKHLAETVCTGLLSRVMTALKQFGHFLPDYFKGPLEKFATPLWGGAAFHIGHHLWNELSGLTTIVEAVNRELYPEVIVLGLPGDGEAYGEIGHLFPELSEFVIRGITSVEEMIGICCTRRIQIVRITGHYVANSLRTRIAALVHVNRNLENERELAMRLALENIPIVVLGLRLENRTVADQDEFNLRLVEYLQQRIGRVAIVVDGHNSREKGGYGVSFRSFTESRAASPITDAERQIAEMLRGKVDERKTTIVDNIGGTMSASLFWLSQAMFFISPWGAGLAKYRWAANLPGVVVSSRWVLQNKGDLHIYDDERYMESPTITEFIDGEHVFDFEEAPVLVQVFRPHHPMYFNFKVNMKALYKVIAGS